MKNLISKEQKDEIDAFCNSIELTEYTINANGEVNTDMTVSIWIDKMTYIPIRFDKIGGNLNIAGNDLTTLEGCPRHVGGDFKCGGNYITTLEGGPTSVGGDYDCSYNVLRSLEGIAESIEGDLILDNNREMVSLYSGNVDVKIGGYCSFANNYNLPDELQNFVNYDPDHDDSTLNLEHINIILKYQRYFEIWNNDMSLNTVKYQELLDEISDGLQ